MGKRKGDDVIVGTQSTAASLQLVGLPNTNGGSPFAAGGAAMTMTHPSPITINNTTTSNTNHTHNRSSHQTTTAPEWLDSASFDHKLWVVRESLKLDNSNDDFLVQVQQCHDTKASVRQQHNSVMTTSQDMQDNLTRQISAEEETCQAESQTAEALETTVQDLMHHRNGMATELSHLDQQQGELQDRIGAALNEANQQVASIDGVQVALKNQVPRLKHQISMYATTTNIKWDYYADDDNANDVDQGEHRLEGHVVRTVRHCFVFCF